jgi:hypothetical protein
MQTETRQFLSALFLTSMMMAVNVHAQDEDLIALTPADNGREMRETTPASFRQNILQQAYNFQSMDEEQLHKSAPGRNKGWQLDQFWVGANARLSFDLIIVKGNVSPGGFLIFRPRSRK